MTAIPSLACRKPHRAVVGTLAIMIALALAGCVVGPVHTTPDPPAGSSYRVEPLPQSTASVAGLAQGDAQRFASDTPVAAQWWKQFNNAELDRRVERALANSPTITSAQAALRQAQETANGSRGSLLPSLDASVGVTRQNGVAAGQPALSPLTLYNTGIGISYRLDLFGGVRQGIRATEAVADLRRHLLTATYLSLAGNVATVSFREAALRAQIATTENIIAIVTEQLDLAQRQHDVGATSIGNVLAAKAQKASIEAQLPALRQQLAATQTQLAVYLGETPAQVSATELSLDGIKLPTDIPVRLPSDLLRQRPDILAAEAQLRRAAAEVGVATANLYPGVALSATWGSQATDIEDLFGSGSAAWSLGLNLLQPLFRGGTLRAQKRAAEAGLDGASADYRQTVLVAFQNVADALRALEADAESLAAQAAAEQATATSLELVRRQFQDGSISYLQVLDATRQFQQARLALIDARAARLADTAALYAALGGGWRDGELPTAGNATTTTTP